MKRNRTYILFLFSIVLSSLTAQDTFVLTAVDKQNPAAIKVKWYSKEFIYPEGVNIYRKDADGTTWDKLNGKALKRGDYIPGSQEYAKDKELKSYVDMVNALPKLEGIALLGAYIQSFKSEGFSRYLGIEYIDNNVAGGRNVQYKITIIKNGTETDLGTSAVVKAGVIIETAPPAEIDIKAGNKKTSIRWLPEPMRYYGVNIYRMQDSTGPDKILVNKDPVIVSKTKNKEGISTYPEQFYLDERLKEDSAYYYVFTTLDFFGNESRGCKPIHVFVKDLDAPSPVVCTAQVKQKSVRLSWRKEKTENDFTGYNVYRAYRAEEKFIKVNATLLGKTDTVFSETLHSNSLFRYVIAAVDRSGNEGLSEEVALEIIDEEPPAAPRGLTASSDTGIVMLSWQANTEPDIRGYLVYQNINKNAPDAAYVLVTPEPLKKNSFQQNLPKNAKNKFLYKVLAVDSSDNRSALSEATVTTLPDIIAPVEPFISNCYQDEKKGIVIEFFKNTEIDLKGYELYRSYSDDGQEIHEKVNTKMIDRFSYRYIDRTFEGAGTVKYYLTAIDSSNNVSKPSNSIRINIKKEEDKVAYEFSHLEVKAQKDVKKYQVKWKISNGSGIFFVVYTLQEGDENFEPQTKNLEDTKCTIEAKKEKKTYVQVRAYNAKGLVAKSEIKLIENK
ncbi:MAG: hypothetical protein K0S33_4146 [Bacteroidetes bacterium]|jgi:hypothetical protein|nr:hypothetical protein [Bacteroidota bacterium]